MEEAIRDACRNLKTVDLSDRELYTSCEPCALCVAAMRIAGHGKIRGPTREIQ
jgi:tRNA(Arg) A34 adenosine deaminase TadA